jgi:hypothetical protein
MTDDWFRTNLEVRRRGLIEVLFRYFAGGTEDNHKILSQINSKLAPPGYIPERYHYTRLLGFYIEETKTKKLNSVALVRKQTIPTAACRRS